MDREKVFLKFCEVRDMRKCVEKVRGFGGVMFLGVSQGFAVFETENDPMMFMSDLMDEGVKISVGVVRTLHITRGIVPVVTSCDECGERFSYLTGFSRSGTQLCDKCLASLIECLPEEG